MFPGKVSLKRFVVLKIYSFGWGVPQVTTGPIYRDEEACGQGKP
jgi:hypothetical protein